MLSTIKLHTKNGWSLGDLVEGQPLRLILDLKPSSRAAAVPPEPGCLPRPPPSADVPASVRGAGAEDSSEESEEERIPSPARLQSAGKGRVAKEEPERTAALVAKQVREAVDDGGRPNKKSRGASPPKVHA